MSHTTTPFTAPAVERPAFDFMAPKAKAATKKAAAKKEAKPRKVLNN